MSDGEEEVEVWVLAGTLDGQLYSCFTIVGLHLSICSVETTFTLLRGLNWGSSSQP